MRVKLNTLIQTGSLIAFQYDSRPLIVFHLVSDRRKIPSQQLMRELYTHARQASKLETFYGDAIMKLNPV